MNKLIGKLSQSKAALLVLGIPAGVIPVAAHAAGASVTAQEDARQSLNIVGAHMINPTTLEILYSNGTRMSMDFYGENIFRIFQDPQGGVIRDPQADPEAQILVDNPRKAVSQVELNDQNGTITVQTKSAKIEFDKKTTLFKVTSLKTGKVVAESVAPIQFEKGRVTVTLKEQDKEYFYGGGVQNGRFSHKGQAIEILNTNKWTDGGVSSPTPFYWSTAGYGMMWYTFKPGKYDFGNQKKGEVVLQHDESYLDLFFMVDDTPVALLNDFYQLTGHPVLLPKFGFYEGHLNAYNRDYWKEDPKGILFEDGKTYVESQTDNGGVKESLNGEKNNYQFSARGVIDRYNAHDMPLGWILPNDGYATGYGQTETLDGNIQNLKEFGDYAHKNGVEIGLWTQSDLYPKEGVSPLLQRDIVKEVRDGGVRVLKTDVAWVGAGYSFGLNGVADVSKVMTYYGNNARPFIISVDGWAGTQRYAGIWTGDQSGGEWEYIRFHIPTYIGSGLSGQPNICSDVDGIFGGKNMPVNVRDFQWKAFTTMQLNMDGWGSNPKYPHIMGEPAASINRWYLKLKSEMMPYTYSIAKEAIDGKPINRAMFLDYPNDYTMGTATRYQFLYGPSLLVAPIYQNTAADDDGNDVRNGIYLPEGKWVDYFTGDVYEGNVVLNNFAAPIWKLPVFVKMGAIIPMTEANNNPNQIDKKLRIYDLYPCGTTSFTEYDDDGVTEQYKYGKGATTQIVSEEKDGKVTVTVEPTRGSFDGMEKNKETVFRLNVTQKPKKVSVKVGKKGVKLTEATSLDEFNQGKNVYFYEAQPNVNRFATPETPFAEQVMFKNPVLHVRVGETDATANAVTLEVKGYVFDTTNKMLKQTGALTAPKAQITDENTKAYTLTPSWEKVDHADYYEIEFNGMIYTGIKESRLLFEDLVPETSYTFKVRAVNKDGHSDWTTIQATTKANPLEFAIKGITAETTCENQGGQEVNKLFDFDETAGWHSKWGKGEAVPFDMLIDLNSINQLDKFQYMSRPDGGNGCLQEGTVYYSMDKENWVEAGKFNWKAGGTHIFEFKDQPTARYIKLSVTKAVNNFGSGLEMYVFRVPNTDSLIPGDINRDNKIDENDLTSYMNYTGLRKGDGDFEYVSIGDLNRNNLIDAFDISAVAVQLETGVSSKKVDPVAGKVTVTPAKKTYNAGEEVQFIVKGTGLKSVNALSFALPYNTDELEYVGIDAKGMKEMKNLTNDRLHTNGQKALYPTFVNFGEKPYLEDGELMVVKFKAKKKVTLNMKAVDGMIVDKYMNSVKF